jgi:selenocysteine-specific elongation factor
LKRPLRHNLNISFHTGASEVPAKLRLLDADSLGPGEEAWAQVRLLEPVALLKGDRFVIRDANDTIGGGTIVETQARRHPRHRATVLDALARQESGSPADLLLAAIAASEPAELEAVMAKTDLDRETARSALTALLEDGRVVALGPGAAPEALYTRQAFAALTGRARTAAEAYLRERPLRRGIAKGELRSRLGVSQRAFNGLLPLWIGQGDLADLGAAVAPPGWTAKPSPAEEKTAAAFLAALRASPFAPPTDGRPSEELLAYLRDAGEIVDVGGGVIFDAAAYREMVDAIVRRTEAEGVITLAEVRNLFETSRKYAQAILEHLDEAHVTVRRGDERVLGRAAPRP